MPRDQYRSLKIPEALMKRVDRYVSTNPDGYTTTPEVVKAAIREFLRVHDVAAQHRDGDGGVEEDSESTGED